MLFLNGQESCLAATSVVRQMSLIHVNRIPIVHTKQHQTNMSFTSMLPFSKFLDGLNGSDNGHKHSQYHQDGVGAMFPPRNVLEKDFPMRCGGKDDGYRHGTYHTRQCAQEGKGWHIQAHQQCQDGNDKFDNAAGPIDGRFRSKVGGNDFFHAQGQGENGKCRLAKGGENHEPNQDFNQAALGRKGGFQGQGHLIRNRLSKHVVSRNGLRSGVQVW